MTLHRASLRSGVCLLFLSLATFAAPLETPAPVKKFTLPTFTPEGYRAALVKGEEARIISSEQIEVIDMHLTDFNGKADEKVETVIISTHATFYPARESAEGNKGVRIVRENEEISGERWTYSKKLRKVVIDGKVRVIFQSQIKDILK